MLGENLKWIYSYGNKEFIIWMGIMGMLREVFYYVKSSDNKDDLWIKLFI